MNVLDPRRREDDKGRRNGFSKDKHHGAVNGVTGSCHELCFKDGTGILIDCGLLQGAETSGQAAGFNQLSMFLETNSSLYN